MFYELIPARYRKIVYAIVALLALCYGTWQASHGDWNQVIAAAITALVSGLAHGNTHPEDYEEPPYEPPLAEPPAPVEPPAPPSA